MIITQKRYLFGDDFTLSRLAIDGIGFTSCPYILEDKVRVRKLEGDVENIVYTKVTK